MQYALARWLAHEWVGWLACAEFELGGRTASPPLPDPHRVNLRSSRLIAKPGFEFAVVYPRPRTSDSWIRNTFLGQPS